MNLQENLYRLRQAQIALLSTRVADPSYSLEISAYSQLTAPEIQAIESSYRTEVLGQLGAINRGEYRQLFRLIVEYGSVNELAAFTKLIELEVKGMGQTNEPITIERPANKIGEFELVPIEAAQDRF